MHYSYSHLSHGILLKGLNNLKILGRSVLRKTLFTSRGTPRIEYRLHMHKHIDTVKSKLTRDPYFSFDRSFSLPIFYVKRKKKMKRIYRLEVRIF